MNRSLRGAVAGALLLLPGLALAQTTNGSVDSGSTQGCARLVQGAAQGASAQIAADNKTIQAPQSVTQLSCLGNFFNGAGLNVVTNFLNPATLLQSVEGQICSAATQAFQSAIGSAQCGINITGFNMGFGMPGFGLYCPSLSFGGGGTSLASVGTGGSSGNTGLYINGNALTPSGYPTASQASQEGQ